MKKPVETTTEEPATPSSSLSSSKAASLSSKAASLSSKAASLSSKAASPSSKAAPKAASKGLPIVTDDDEYADNALSAAWPEAVLVLSDDERERRVRRGLDTVLLDEVDDTGRRTRGFVRAVLRVPLDHPKARVYGVFIEVDRAGYGALQKAFAGKTATRVRGRLATRLPFLDDAYGTDVEVLEDGSDNRARVVDVESPSLRDGPQVGPRARRPSSP